MITFNDIYEAAKKERYSEQLQSLPKTFIQSVVSYLNEKKEIASKDDDSFSDIIIKTKKQLENAYTLFNELKRIRRKKILTLVLIASETGISKKDFDNMLDFERELFEDMMKCIDTSDKRLAQAFEGKEKTAENAMIVFNEDVEEFLDLSGEKVGPFTKGEIANLSKEIVKIIVEDGKAEYVND